MPIPALGNLGEKAGKSKKTIERYWRDGVKSAEERGIKNKYAYAMAISKRRAGIKEADLRILKSSIVREKLRVRSKFGQRLVEALDALDTTNRLTRVELTREGKQLIVKVTLTPDASGNKGTFEFEIRDGAWADISRQINAELIQRGYNRDEITNVPSRRGS